MNETNKWNEYMDDIWQWKYERIKKEKNFEHKRYALEGNEVMTAAIDAVFATASKNGVSHIVIGMPHRGRLNFLTGKMKLSILQLFISFLFCFFFFLFF